MVFLGFCYYPGITMEGTFKHSPQTSMKTIMFEI